jgi:hypothetical protein
MSDDRQGPFILTLDREHPAQKILPPTADNSAPLIARGILAWVPSSTSTRVMLSGDGARVSIETWIHDGTRWRLAGVAPSFATILLSAVVDAMHQAHDRLAGEIDVSAHAIPAKGGS